jgi:hypothetical protein
MVSPVPLFFSPMLDLTGFLNSSYRPYHPLYNNASVFSRRSYKGQIHRTNGTRHSSSRHFSATMTEFLARNSLSC